MDIRIFLLSVLVVAVSGVPIPENEIIFTTTTTTADGLVEEHRNLSSVCQSMLPAHGNNTPQNSPAPYLLRTNTLKVAPGGVVEVQVLNKEDLKPFRGVYMQARDQQGVPVGEFLPSNDNHVILSSCGEGHNNAIAYSAEITFYATIVLSFSEFWNPISSETVTVANL
ncbi:hypothetical protein L9F63_011907 [Diploptera punctata]|uniref:Reelin domain-containing protein n=1 Tax=Diploptera punctata TaxID=6984 RepID=A0AAD8AGA1_DIPPU|nr:hypothetical protein L9F63_011907 [Diploptera punctata]